MSTIIISEIGENHLGNMDIAKKMIALSKDAGADYAKFQLYDANKTRTDDPERDWFFKVALSKDQMADLTRECRSLGIGALFTCWDTERAQWCVDEGIEEMKLASFHISDKGLLEFAGRNFKSIFLSTGMSTLDDIKNAVKALNKVNKLYLLHCVSDYPAKDEDIDLKVMDTLRQFSRYVGYSDHTLGTTAILAAVARGADVVEKHFTLSKDMPGTDHIFSADPAEFKYMVKEIRKIEKMLGSGKKQMTHTENKNRSFLRNRFSYQKTAQEAR